MEGNLRKSRLSRFPLGSWNRYAYTRGDPINRSDPSGLIDCNAGNRFSITVCGHPGSLDVYAVEAFLNGVFGPPTDIPIGVLEGMDDDTLCQLGFSEACSFQPQGGGGGGGSTVPFNLENAVEDSRQRVEKLLSTQDCASAIGAPSIEAAQQRVNSIHVRFSESPLTFSESGEGEGWLAEYSRVGGGFMRLQRAITFNTAVNWQDPASTVAVGGASMNVLGGLSAEVKAGSMTASQFMDLIFLHELAHSFGGDHLRSGSSTTSAPTQAEYNSTIWVNCF